MTVSRALSSQKIVKQETRDKILEAARKMGYIPNLTAKNLKTQKSYEIGLLFHIGDTFGFREPFVVEILENFMTVVAEKGYSLSIINADALHNQSLLNYSFSKSFDGVFVLCGDFTNSAVVELVESNLPVVAVDFMESDLTTINFVSTDNRQMMFELTNYIISMGHTNIVYLTGQKCYVTYERKKGFLKALEVNRLDFHNEMFIEAEFHNDEIVEEKLNEIFARKNPPSVIILPDDGVVMTAYEFARKRNLKIPEDISFAGFDGIKISRQVYPKLCTVKQDAKKLGEYSAKRLLDLIENKNAEANYAKIVKGTLIKGESIAKLKR